MSYLTLDQIAKAKDLETMDLEMPEWGGTIKLQSISAAKRLELAALVSENKEKQASSITMIAKFAIKNSLVEPKIESDDQVDMLLSKSASAIEKIVEAFNKLAGMSDEAILEARGNS